MLIEGRDEPPGPLAKALNEYGYVLPALPNMFFTRDSCVVAGEHVLIGSMRYAIRWTEAIIMKALFTHHPGARQRGHSVRRRVGAARELHARGRRHPSAAPRPRRDRLQRALEPGGDRSDRDEPLRADAMYATSSSS